MSISQIERTTGQILAPDGVTLLQRPTLIFGADAAAIIRSYFAWAMKSQLEPELFCATCYNGSRDDKAIYNITQDEIDIICRCTIRFFKGASLPPAPLGVCVTAPKADEAGVADVLLSPEIARLLRNYKKVLLDYGLKEALRCNACFELSGADGCEASVTEGQIRIRCRCTNRTFIGSAL